MSDTGAGLRLRTLDRAAEVRSSAVAHQVRSQYAISCETTSAVGRHATGTCQRTDDTERASCPVAIDLVPSQGCDLGRPHRVRRAASRNLNRSGLCAAFWPRSRHTVRASDLRISNELVRRGQMGPGQLRRRPDRQRHQLSFDNEVSRACRADLGGLSWMAKAVADPPTVMVSGCAWASRRTPSRGRVYAVSTRRTVGAGMRPCRGVTGS
jgi:hypothetical protein